jgi:serine/threonine protein kinase
MIGLLIQPLENLGFIKHLIAGVEIVECLGFGGQSTVFSGKYNNKSYVIKIYEQNNYYMAEKNSLTLLANNNVVNVPRIISETKTATGKKVLIIEPIAHSVQPNLDGRVVNSTHIIQLIDILNTVHILKICHNDVKPDNIYIDRQSGMVLLNDWGSSSAYNVVLDVRGTYGFYDLGGVILASYVDDLKALVRSAYLMLFNLSPPTPNINFDLQHFWGDKFRVETIWQKAVELCESCNYAELRRLFCTLK